MVDLPKIRIVSKMPIPSSGGPVPMRHQAKSSFQTYNGIIIKSDYQPYNFPSRLFSICNHQTSNPPVSRWISWASQMDIIIINLDW